MRFSFALRAVAAAVLLASSCVAQSPSPAPGTPAAESAAQQATTTGSAAGVPAGSVAAAVNSAQPASGAVPGQPTAPRPSAAATLTKLPAPLPPELIEGIDAQERARDILAHLSAVIRFYRAATANMQKIGEPSDMVYADQFKSTATQAAQLAFQSARDEAALLARMNIRSQNKAQDSSQQQAARLMTARTNAAHRIADLEAQQQQLTQQLQSAKAKQRPALQEQQQVVEGQLELARAMSEALGKVAGISETQGSNGLLSDIDRLQRSAPELVDSKAKPVTATVESLENLRDAGVSTQGAALFQLLGTSRAIAQRIQETDTLLQQAQDLRTPLIKILRTTVQIGQQAQQAPPPAAAGSVAPTEQAQLRATRERYDELTTAFKALSEVSVPLSQEILLLEQSRANLQSWQAAVAQESSSILRALLIRIAGIALALGVLALISEFWRRATIRYIGDVRRRRQLLVVRRIVMGFLSGLVIIFGFVTQFNSLATFAGFITAGIAVGLQTILLSVAAYFFIVGRYGIRVGDRITVAGVTGDVIEVGLVRFYLAELAGTGTELHSTGRVAVLSNSVLFQAGTPLYKQMPGTEYAWHELTAKLNDGEDAKAATSLLERTVRQVYDTYRSRIDQQHSRVESWMDAAVAAPAVESYLQLTDTGLQCTILFPVEMRRAAEVDQQITEALLEALRSDENARKAFAASPVIRASVRG